MLNQLKITSKLLIGFGTLMLLVALVSVISTLGSLGSKTAISELAIVKSNEALAEKIEKKVFEARMQVWVALASGDETRWKLVDEAIAATNEDVKELTLNTLVPARRAQVPQLADMIKSYHEASMPLRALNGKNAALDTPEVRGAISAMHKIGGEITSLGNTLSSGYHSTAVEKETDAKKSTEVGVMLAVGIGLLSLLIGLALSYFISKSIKTPIVNLTDVMAALAKGDLTVSVPYVGDANELGDMARSVMVFKENGLERQRLEAEAVAARAAAEADRERTAAERAKAAEEQARVVRHLGEGLRPWRLAI